MYRDERVIFVVNAACLRVVVFSPLLCTDLRCVCLGSLYMLRLRVVRMKTEHLGC